LDFSRAALFSLGIVLHAAWLCQDQSAGFRVVHDFIHGFRMPGFFLIGGFVCAMMLSKYSAEEFLLKRLQRLAIPFVSCVALNFLINAPNLDTWGNYSLELSGGYWATGRWLEHLWFLATFIVYVALLFVVQKLWPSFDSKVRRIKPRFGLFLAVLALLYFASGHVERAFPPVPWAKLWFVIDQIQFLKYCTFFAAGYFVFHHQELLEQLSQRVLFNVVSASVFWLAGPLVSQWPGGRYLVQSWETIYALNICGLLFWVAKRFFDNGNPMIRSISDASYTMYLVHWPIMILLNRILETAEFPVGLLFTMFVVLTAVLSYACHVHIVNRWELMRLLINGQTVSPRFAPRTATAVAACAVDRVVSGDHH